MRGHLCARAPCSHAGFLNSVATFVPAVAGVDLEGLVKQVCCRLHGQRVGTPCLLYLPPLAAACGLGAGPSDSLQRAGGQGAA